MSTSPAEGDQFPHPDSPAGREETEEEARARWQRETEAAQAEAIDLSRDIARRHLREAATHLRLMDRALRRLHEDDLYDVEYADTHSLVLVTNARAQIDVAMAAIEHTIPAEGESR